VSVVAFQFLNIKVLGIAVPGHRRFEEINLRFYVSRDHAEGNRRGVVFIREVVPRRAIAFAARLLYHEPYVALPTRSSVVQPSGGARGRFAYGWKGQEGWNELEASASGMPRVPRAESLERFITDHHWGYNVQRSGSTMEYRVEHPAWGVWDDPAGELHADFTDLDSPGLAPYLQQAPANLLVAEGSPVTVYRGQRID
jgi:uncharacterized protein YqjF (DUF2071 family)